MAGKRKKTGGKRTVIRTVLGFLILIGGIPDTVCMGESPDPVETVMEKILEHDPEAVISVGIWENGNTEEWLYTAEGKKDFVPYTYQIGSVTKTFTGAMIAYEEAKGILSLEEGTPSLERLVTHRSGLSDEWEQALMKDPEKCFTREELVSVAEELNASDGAFCYSNFGSALAGTVASERYAANLGLSDSSCQAAMDHFITEVLGLEHTKVGGKGDFKNNWNWKDKDEMRSAGSVISTIPDLLLYGQRYLSSEESDVFLKEAIRPRASMDETFDIGMFWFIEKESGMFWHNGEVAMDDENGNEVGYQSFLGISPEKNRVVAVLTNTICNDEEEDTAYTDVLGLFLIDR